MKHKKHGTAQQFTGSKTNSQSKRMTPMKTSKQTHADTKDQAACMAEMAEALRENCEQALRTSLKFQEEAGRWWTSVVDPAACAQQWQQQLNAATRTANSVLPLTQKQ